MTIENRQALRLPSGLCRRCVRTLSRRLSDLPGMVWFQVDAPAGILWFSGGVDPASVDAAVSVLRCP